jgi:oxygen-independent coproporphyrinogen-3 oxidase
MTVRVLPHPLVLGLSKDERSPVCMEHTPAFCYNETVTSRAIYLHVPFCRRKCGYCSFVSCAGRESEIPAYVVALRREIAGRASGAAVPSIFFGGGTPSLLSVPRVETLLDTVHEHFVVAAHAEITLEANPGTVDEAYLGGLRRAGVNRLSLGAQRFEDSELTALGRLHSAAEARQAFTAARRAGFGNINLDLIYGLPGDSAAAWRTTLEAAVELKPEHLSLYPLTLEPDTPLGEAVAAGDVPAPDPDVAADQYELAEDCLEAAGYDHYEISNWARPARECRHNLVYWDNAPYLGFGVAAHSSVDGRRCANTNDLDEYLAAGGLAPLALDERLDAETRRAETVILGLRQGRGIDLAATSGRLGTDVAGEYHAPFEDMTAAGLLERYDGRLRLTRRGRLLGNEVFWRLLPETGLT